MSLITKTKLGLSACSLLSFPPIGDLRTSSNKDACRRSWRLAQLWIHGLGACKRRPCPQSGSVRAQRTVARRCFSDGGCSAHSICGLLLALLERPSLDPVALWPNPMTPAIDLIALARLQLLAVAAVAMESQGHWWVSDARGGRVVVWCSLVAEAMALLGIAACSSVRLPIVGLGATVRQDPVTGPTWALCLLTCSTTMRSSNERCSLCTSTPAHSSKSRDYGP